MRQLNVGLDRYKPPEFYEYTLLRIPKVLSIFNNNAECDDEMLTI